MTTIVQAAPADAEAILALQKLAYQSEARLYDDWSIPPLTQTIESLRGEFATSLVLKAVSGSRIVGSVRAKIAEGTCTIGRLIVDPEFQRQGIGSMLLQSVEAECGGSERFELFTGTKSEANIRLYQRHGYAITRTEPLSPMVTIVFLEKPGPTAP
jgi:ribosomal protein S18 acetylase RimI-like enzyme